MEQGESMRKRVARIGLRTCETFVVPIRKGVAIIVMKTALAGLVPVERMSNG